jgi:hypothetical protein
VSVAGAAAATDAEPELVHDPRYIAAVRAALATTATSGADRRAARSPTRDGAISPAGREKFTSLS